MLLRFRVTNWASLRDEQELSLVASDRHDDLALRDVPGTGLRVLPVVGVFGANASGKSKLVHAMFYARSVVLLSQQKWTPNAPTRREPFLLDSESAAQPSEFVFDLVIGGTRYEYGFALDHSRITGEWLYGWPHGRIRTLFERSGPEQEDITIGPGLRKGFGTRTRTARESVRPNSLLVSAGAANNHPLLTEIYNWFERMGPAHDSNAESRHKFTVEMLKGERGAEARRLLRLADLGITGVRSEEEREMPVEAATHLTEVLKILEPDAHDLDPGEWRLSPKIFVSHQTAEGEVELPYAVESHGTQTWLELLGPVLQALATGRVLVVDELDAYLHPNLAGQLVMLFQEPATNPHGAQLVFNTHDATLLDRHSYGRLVRDQVWLTEKDETGATELIALREYKARNRDDVMHRYLLGRFGAVPVLNEENLPDFERAS
ncbi:AAA family ATPase [Halostreptopolyspora alba]